jgi:hypothetical protein
MIRLIQRFAASIAILSLLSLASVSAQAGELELSANTPDISIQTRPAGRNFMRLPSLEYAFTIETSCPADLEPESVSLSIADTRIVLDAGDLAANRSISVSVTVPAAQIGPVALNRFCAHGADEEARNSDSFVRIPSVLSAQAALICAGESASEITYASENLGVILHCEQPAESETHAID